MRLILAELPMQYQEDAEVYIHQSFENGESSECFSIIKSLNLV